MITHTSSEFLMSPTKMSNHAEPAAEVTSFVTITVKGTTITLTMQEARALAAELNRHTATETAPIFRPRDIFTEPARYTQPNFMQPRGAGNWIPNPYPVTC
jgi:hypothetical protein